MQDRHKIVIECIKRIALHPNQIGKQPGFLAHRYDCTRITLLFGKDKEFPTSKAALKHAAQFIETNKNNYSEILVIKWNGHSGQGVLEHKHQPEKYFPS